MKKKRVIKEKVGSFKANRKNQHIDHFFQKGVDRIEDKEFKCGFCRSTLVKDKGYETVRRCKNESCELFNQPMSCQEG